MKIRKGAFLKSISIFIALCIIVSTGLTGIPALAVPAPPVGVDGLLVNGVADPLAIDPGSIFFSWRITANARGVMQTAYRILIQEALTGRIVWDSGKVLSSDSANVPYTGETLPPDSAYHWQVKVWDNGGSESAYSSEAFFNIGLAASDWTADYIWDTSANANNYAYFRKGFTINKPVKHAVVYTSAHNDYQLYLNGEFVGAGPARSDPYAYGQYCAYDITSQLLQGLNAFASLAHWHGVWSNSGVNASPAYILEAHITYEDHSTEIIKTDSSWKTMPKTPYIEENPVYFGHYGGERNRASIQYDSRREIIGWNTTRFDDSSWQSVQTVDRSNYKLYAQLVGEQKEAERVEPLSVTKEGDRWLVDFGKCLTGWPEIKIHNNAAGDSVRVQYWEVNKGWGDAGYDTYICSGGEERFYAPYVRHTSFRLLEISGYQGTLTAGDVRGIVAYSDADNAGSFLSSDQRLNQVYAMSERSGRQNIQQGIISVDANREQSPWTADSWNIGIGMLYNHRNTMLIDKVIKDYAAEQLSNGNFLTCSPARDYHSEMAEWSLYWPMLVWEQYLFSGDRQLLIDSYPNLVKFITYMEGSRSRVSGLYNPGGWRASDYAGGSMVNGGENIATNAQMYMVLNISADISEIIGAANADTYRKAAQSLYTSINSFLFVNGECYKSSTSSTQTHPLGTAWALRAGVVPEAFKERVIQWLAKQNQSYNVGGYGGDALYNGLYTANLGHIATLDFARYDNMLNTNQTNWESFGELSIDNMGNHAWTAYPSYLLQKYVGGIRPTGGGFSKFDIKHVTGGLDFASACVPTVKGEIKTMWKKTDQENLTLTAEVPANTTAQIYLPDHDLSEVTVTEGGAVIFQDGAFLPAKGISSGMQQKDYIVFSVGSGVYQFHITGTPKNTPLPGEREIVPIDDNGLIIDDGDAAYTGSWIFNNNSNEQDRYGEGFHYAAPAAGAANAFATYSVLADRDSAFDIYAWWCVHPNRATNTPITISAGDYTETFRFNQQTDGGRWVYVGSCEASRGQEIKLVIGNDADAYVISDAVKIVPKIKTGIVIDDDAAVFTGNWYRETDSNQQDRYGEAFHYSAWVPSDSPPTATATYAAQMEQAGKYAVYGWWGTHQNRATDTPFSINTAQSSHTYRVNQQINGGRWNLIGTCEIAAGERISVVIGNNANQYVIADAIRIAPDTGEDAGKFTPLQELQLFVLEMRTVSTYNCKIASYVTAFKNALEHAAILCADLNTKDEQAIAAKLALEQAYRNILDNVRVSMALNKKVTASESMEVANIWSAQYLTDGHIALTNESRVGYTTKEYKTQMLETPIEIIIDLEEAMYLNTVSLIPRMSAVSWNGVSANFPQDFEIQISTDGMAYQTVFAVSDQENPGFEPLDITFDTVTGRYIRLHVTKLGEYAADEGIATPYRLQLAEIEVHYIEPEPQAADRSELKALIDTAHRLAEQDYTPESWAGLVDALAQAKAVFADTDADQNAVNAACTDLDKAIKALVKEAGGEDIPISKIKINASGLFTLSVKKKAQIPVTIEPSNATDQTVKWISTNSNIFTVDEEGCITPHKQGTATLTAQSSNGLKSTIIVRITA